MRRLSFPLVASLIILFSILLFSFSSSTAVTETDKPKLVVAVVIDQMRYEYLERFANKFSENGFKRLMKEGYNFKNTHYNYMPTETGPGHAAIHTGATPMVSGIIGNAWYDRSQKKSVNVVSGLQKYKAVGVAESLPVGQAGPDRLLVTTIADELKTTSQFKSKSIAVSIKDRGAILGGGHTADGAYWYDPLTGRFITSSYYMDTLPEWVNEFNSNGLVDSLNRLTWDTSFPIESYTESREDNNRYERKFRKDKTPTFPYDFKELNPDSTSYFYIPYTPFGNDLVERMAESAVINEKMGMGELTDFLSVSFSSTDYCGHMFGPYSVELQDMYIKLDQTIAKLLSFLDKRVGKDNYVFVLSSDHGVMGVPFYLKEKKLPAGIYNSAALASRITNLIKIEFDIDSIVLYQDYLQIYLDHDRLKSPAQAEKVKQAIKTFLEKEDMLHSVYTREELLQLSNPSLGPHTLLQNTFFAQRSGDIFYIPKPNWLGYVGTIATSHGTPYAYDTHVPLLWYGKNIPQGSSVRRVSITDIAPSLSFLCGTMIPNGSYGHPLEELFE